MQVRHRNITNSTSPVRLLASSLGDIKGRVAHSLLISNTYTAASVVSVYIRAVDRVKTEKARLYGVSSGSTLTKYTDAFFIVKKLSIPKETAVDIFADFPKGFNYKSNYELVIELADASHAVSTILAYE